MIGIVDYGMGNLKSVANAVYEQGYDPLLCQTQAEFDQCSHVILPGVGHFKKAMENITKRGLNQILEDQVLFQKKPLLGICLGMQLLLTDSDEGSTSANQTVPGLNLIAGHVTKFNDPAIRVPHVGWNELELQANHPVLSNIKNGTDVYFVHSYYCQTIEKADTIATTSYQTNFASIVAKNNIIGVQFHPEKSQIHGMSIIESFCEWDGQC